MCGIAGFIQVRDDSPLDVVSKQLECLHHRGPDASGYFTGRRGAIGQTRLSIIDLVTGDPPITNEDESIAVALNGEIYNYAALRARLREAGHSFATEGDTEVLAHLAEEGDARGIARSLEGMFAFAVWDDRKERLVLGRDRWGKKPLYYWSGNGHFVFASEIKALLAHPAVPKRLWPDALSAYLTFGYVPTPHTFFDEIYSVPPATVLVVEPGGDPRLETYWETPKDASGTPDCTFDEAALEVRRLLGRAVERRLVGDVPVGAFLSGGIDSSALVALMARATQNPVRTFTIGFDDRDGFDERPFAAAIAARYRTDHVVEVVRPNAVELIERLVWHHDQPFGDSSAIPTFLLSEITRRDVKVAVAGDGGDELFAGYERFSAALFLRRYQRLPSAVRRGASKTLELLPPRALSGRAGSVQRFAARAELDLPEAFLSWLSYTTLEQRRRLLPGGSEWAAKAYRATWDQSHGTDLDRLLDLNLRTYLVDDLLVKVDRTSMAHGLEVRSPFLDRELGEFVLSLPSQHKARGWSRKRVLKAAVADLVPQDLLRRPKRGFGVPLDRWFRSDLASYVAGMLGARARVHAHLNGEVIRGLVEEHAQGRSNHGHLLWALLTLEVFLRREGW